MSALNKTAHLQSVKYVHRTHSYSRGNDNKLTTPCTWCTVLLWTDTCIGSISKRSVAWNISMVTNWIFFVSIAVLIFQALHVGKRENFVIATTNREEIKDDPSWGKLRNQRTTSIYGILAYMMLLHMLPELYCKICDLHLQLYFAHQVFFTFSFCCWCTSVLSIENMHFCEVEGFTHFVLFQGTCTVFTKTH